MQQLWIVVPRKPFRVPGLDDPEAKNFRMRLLTHEALTPLLVFIEDDRQMTEPFANTRGSALSTRCKPLPHPSLIDLDAFDVKPIDIDALRVLRVRNRGPKRLRYEACRALRYELERIE